MKKFEFSLDWLAAGGGPPEQQQTMAMLSLHAGEVNLTHNEDIWSKTTRDSILVSAYPLAMWFASSWWRLLCEPLPDHHLIPTVDWRMAHELGAANHGFVWPQILFASDKEAIQIWAVPSRAGTQQSVRYVSGLDAPVTIALSDFQSKVGSFIAAVVARLEAVGIQNSPLSCLWQEVQ